MNTSHLRFGFKAAAALAASICPVWALDSGMVKGQTAATPDPIAYPADGTAMQAAGSIHLPADWKLELFAAEPHLSDPVAMNFDERGRLYIALHHRNRHGTEDSREHRYWREDDQAAHTVEDRLRYMEKWAAAGKKPMSYFTDIPDRIVCVEDRDGDGKADTSREIARFQEPLDGVNAGVLAQKEMFGQPVFHTSGT